MSKSKIEKPKLLLVEGNHECDVFTAWLNKLAITDIEIRPIAGKTQLRDKLEAIINDEMFQNGDVISLVVVRDADNDHAAAFQSVRDALQAHSLPAPEFPWQFTQGTIPKVAVVVMPGPAQTGALEELLIQTVPQDPLYSPSLELIQHTVRTLEGNAELRNPPPEHRRGKARIHAFLSTFEEPDKDPGKAALAGVWDFNHPCLQPLLQILRQM